MKRFFVILMALTLLFVFAGAAYATLTVTNKVWISLGNKRMLEADVAWDDSYSFGGEAFDPNAYGFTGTPDIIRISSKSGYDFEYDYTNETIRAFTEAPPVVYEEKHTIPAATTYTVTLDYPAAYVMNICSATANYAMLSAESTVGSGEILVELYEGTPGTRALLTANSKLAYIKQPASGFLVDRSVVEEASIIASGAGYSSWPILLWGTAGYVVDGHTTEQTPSVMMLAGDGLGTSSEAYIDWFRSKTLLGSPIVTNGSTSTRLSSTYIKGVPWEIPGLVPLEVKNAVDLSGLTGVKLEIIGH